MGNKTYAKRNIRELLRAGKEKMTAPHSRASKDLLKMKRHMDEGGKSTQPYTNGNNSSSVSIRRV